MKALSRAVGRSVALLLIALLLSSCGLPLLQEIEADGMTYALYGNGRVEQIEVRQDKKTIGTYQQKGLKENVLKPLGISDYGFRLADLNFDGKADMQLMTVKTEGAHRYATYIWDESRGEFAYHAALSALQNVTLIDSLQALSAWEYEYTIDPATSDTPEFYTESNHFVLYRWIDGRLTEVHRKEKTYYQESDIYCYAVYDRDENGEMELTRESWVDPEKMNDDKYPLDATGFEGYVPH